MNLHESISSSRKTANSKIAEFFDSRDFSKADFKEGKNIFISNYYRGEATSVKLKPRPNYTTYYKTVSGGVLIFQVSLQNGFVEYECYSPLWLFGIWSRKMYFKEKPSAVFHYLKEGFSVQQDFCNFLVQKFNKISKKAAEAVER